MANMPYIYDANTITRRRRTMHKITLQTYQRLYAIMVYHAICNLENFVIMRKFSHDSLENSFSY